MKHARLLFSLFVICILSTAAVSCSDDDDTYFDMMPTKIRSFVVSYYPNPTVDAVSHTDDGWYVVLKDGPSFRFNTTQDWYEVNGNGMPLPQVFVYDQFPGPLYGYLSETQNTANVFAVSRTKTAYKVTLLDSAIDYDIATETVHTSTAH